MAVDQARQNGVACGVDTLIRLKSVDQLIRRADGHDPGAFHRHGAVSDIPHAFALHGKEMCVDKEGVCMFIHRI